MLERRVVEVQGAAAVRSARVTAPRRPTGAVTTTGAVGRPCSRFQRATVRQVATRSWSLTVGDAVRAAAWGIFAAGISSPGGLVGTGSSVISMPLVWAVARTGVVSGAI